MVAISSKSWAGNTLALSSASLASSPASRDSPKISKSLFDAAPSVPIPTRIPRSLSLSTGQRPLANFMFERGQWITEIPRSPINSTSLELRAVMCTACSSGISSP